ncbi:Glycosyl transferase, family 8 [Streptococcus sp. DD11]|nr:glycosyltransferase [Streptococcus sp. DD11]KXT82475.1 Glycosyl transferase, family 8 [Streptococcus sp. DD11]
MRETGNELLDVKLFREDLRQKWQDSTFGHINYMAYARYFIPEYVPADRVLYLDCDLIVTQNLEHLFELELDAYYIAAVRATFGLGIGFNSGVMLINNQRWRQENISQQLVELTDREIETALEGDQSILNMLFADQYWPLDDSYNFQIGFDMGAAQMGHDFIFELPLSPLPAIIHYISGQKPWDLLSNMRLREVWWFYNHLEWSSIIASKSLQQPSKSTQPCSGNYRLECLTLTDCDVLEKLEELAEALPDCLFHVAAYTAVSDRLVAMMAHDNIRLHRSILPVRLKQLMASCDIYLDINYAFKFRDVLQSFENQGRPIFTFDSTKTEGITERVFAADRCQEMVEAIQSYSG